MLIRMFCFRSHTRSHSSIPNPTNSEDALFPNDQAPRNLPLIGGEVNHTPKVDEPGNHHTHTNQSTNIYISSLNNRSQSLYNNRVNNTK
jgi:hypothetical protein